MEQDTIFIIFQLMENYVVIGGAGAYCSTMTPFNYNSHTQAPELLLNRSGELLVMRVPQTLTQVVQNERSVLESL